MGGASKLLTLVVAPVPRLYCFSPAALRLPLSRPLSTVPSRRLLVSRPRRHALALRVTAAHQLHTQASLRNTFPHPSSALLSHEWSRLVDHLKSFGHSEGRISVLDAGDDDAFLDGEGLSEEFLKMAEVCLSFARDRPEVLRLLSRKDVEVVVENGSPFLFMNGVNSVRRMKAFLCGNGSDVLQSETAQTVDLMRYLLSYKRGSLNTDTTHDGMELIECSVRNLLTELVNLCGGGQQSNITESTRRMPPLGHEQFSRLPRPNIEMKRGDWICPKCSFMNFAKNMKCLECDETRPKRQLAGGEWECPQCDFFNYGRNRSCLRCDCKRPGDSALNAGVKGNVLGPSRDSSIDQIFNGSNSDKSEIERRLAANDEKAERWFSKMSQLDDTSDLSSAIADEDFPEIMPLRKGTNRFVVSTRKTPLERRLANVQYRRNLESPGNSQSGGFSGTGSEKTTESSISESLDRILGRSSGASGASDATNQSANGEMNSGAASRFNLSEHRQSISQQGDTGYVPFVPLNPDMFRKSPKPDNDGHQSSVQVDSSSVKSVQPSGYTDSVFGSSGSSNVLPAGNLESSVESKEEAGSSEASERWHTKATELDNVVDSATSISNDDFPEIMPMRKGENRFVVSKKKDRSLTSPQYKRRLALEQSNSSNFVPFVPFPPGYFAKKDKQPEAATSVDASIESSLPAEKAEAGMLEDKSGDAKSVSAGYVPRQEKQSSTENTNHYNGAAAQTFEAPTNYWNNSKDSGNSDVSQRRNAFGSANTMGNLPHRTENSQNTGGSWNGGFSGKSLEGSAVKEPDPLDMSEEAKAERWFRRAAQIKDISELSQIPDEDFPEIMPMRKGVNRFVVSKRKTPLERRLTSAQYRRNLPIVSSEPKNDAS